MISLTALTSAIPGVRRLYLERNKLLTEVSEWESRNDLLSSTHASVMDAMGTRMEALERQLEKISVQNTELIALCEQLAVQRHQHEFSPEYRSHSGMPKPGDDGRSTSAQDEIDVCRALASRCVFVLGFARSSTTVMVDMLNTAGNALILGEANLYQAVDAPRWRDFYNAKHKELGNQATKSTYAPDFIPESDHTWWQWLEAASSRYDVLGDKMAFTSYHLTQFGPDAFLRFFEARFFDSKFVLLIRNPIDCILSTAKLIKLNDDASIRREIDAWLCYIQLWAHVLRNFPHTLTVFAEDLSAQSMDDLASFTGLDLAGAHALLDDEGKRHHELPAHFETLIKFRDRLIGVYGLARLAMGREPDRSLAEPAGCTGDVETLGGTRSWTKVPFRVLGRLYTVSQDLRAELAADPTAQIRDGR